MTKRESIADEELYSRAGKADGLNPKAPLTVQEKGSEHRAATDVLCHDCGQYIVRGEVHTVSRIEALKGMRGVTHRYEIHNGCYEVVGRVVALLGKEATHTFDGRPPLKDLWAKHKDAIRAADAELAKMLEGAFDE